MDFMLVYPLTAWNYVGIESLGFAYNLVHDPNTSIPLGSLACVATLFVTSILVLFVSSSLQPIYQVARALSPLDVGIINIYGVSSSVAVAFTVPACYATAFGFIFSYGKLISSLGISKLLPEVVGRCTSDNSQPYVAMLAGSLVGYAICLIAIHNTTFAKVMFNFCVMSAFACYISQCVGYILLQTKFASLKRHFTSPLGIFGACYSIAVFGWGFIAAAGFQNDNGTAAILFVVVLACSSLYYRFIVSHKQGFSEEELKVMFKAYVVKANDLRNNQKRTVVKPMSKSNAGGRSARDSSNEATSISAHDSTSVVHSTTSETVHTAAFGLYNGNAKIVPVVGSKD
jgi:ethanolamine permease